MATKRTAPKGPKVTKVGTCKKCGSTMLALVNGRCAKCRKKPDAITHTTAAGELVVFAMPDKPVGVSGLTAQRARRPARDGVDAYTGKLKVKVTPPMLEAVRRIAGEERRSVSMVVRDVLAAWLEARAVTSSTRKASAAIATVDKRAARPRKRGAK